MQALERCFHIYPHRQHRPLAPGHARLAHPARDHGRTEGIEPAKTNWAQKLDKPPYLCWPVTGGITFTFGGLRVDKESGQVVDSNQLPIPGLYCAGEMVGGLFYFNYPSGTGLVPGAVFGKLAGTAAGQAAKQG